MKKALSLILALVLCLSLCACGESDSSNPYPTEPEFVKPDNYAMVVLVTINPQVRLYIDKDGQVLAVESANKDAKKVIEDLDFRNKSYEAVISEFITAANASGYVNESARIVFKIVESKDQQLDTEDVLSKAADSAKDTIEELKISAEIECEPYVDSSSQDQTEGTAPEETHIHDYSDATCTAPKTCKTCGATDGAANGHNWQDATCTAPKTCKTCGATDGAANGHNWQDATCTAPKTCKTCGATDGAANGHNWQDATCTAPKTCKTCGATDGAANGHNYIDGICSVCSGVQENYKALDTGIWTGTQVVNGTLYKVKLSFKDLFFSAMYGANIHDPDFDPNFRDQLLQAYDQDKNALTVIDGVYYYTGSGDGGSITYTVNGNSIQADCDGWINLSITRTAGNQLTITKCDEIANLPGIILTWQDG